MVRFGGYLQQIFILIADTYVYKIGDREVGARQKLLFMNIIV